MKFIKNINQKTIIVIIFISAEIFVLQTELREIVLDGLQFNNLAAALTPIYRNINNTMIQEADNISDSDNNNFWLNSGALFYLEKNYNRTTLGDLPKDSSWRLAYKNSNPVDTDDGYHPQNIFRLITKNTGDNISQSVYVLIVKDNLSQSPNRNESNGVLIMSRYQDANNLYYAGIRVDGTAIIKKKINGVYNTLAQATFIEGNPYDRISNSSLLPKDQWIGLKVNIQNIDSDTVEIELFIDKDDSGNWTKVLSALDKKTDDNITILNEGHGGIRSDFMDIEIKDYSFTPLQTEYE